MAIDPDALLEQWRKTRSPRIADVLQTVPLDGVDWKAIQRAKPAAAKTKIAKLPDDPRVTVWIVEQLRAARWAGASAKALWGTALDRLIELRDPRAIEPLRAAVKEPPYFFGAAFTEWMLDRIGATADALEKAPRNADDFKITKSVKLPTGGWFAKKKAPASVEQIVAEVWASPDDMAVRSVAADVLLEQEDPWGELIALQLAHPDKRNKRVDELLRKIAGKITGPIGQVATRDGMVFEAGFLVECRLDKSMVARRRWEDAATTPYWSTVHTVHPCMDMPTWFPAKWLVNPALARLRRIDIYTRCILERDNATAPWRFVKAPQGKLDYSVTKPLKSILKGLPKPELARIAVTSKSVGALIEKL
jgi:hypothetical protein